MTGRGGSAFPHTARQIHDEDDQEDQPEPATAYGRTAEIKAATTKEEEQHENQ